MPPRNKELLPALNSQPTFTKMQHFNRNKHYLRPITHLLNSGD
jgi:hypothetical protein